MDDISRAKRPERVPVVLNRDEVRRVLDQLAGVHCLVCGLLYRSGLRLLEALRLRGQACELPYVPPQLCDPSD